MTATKIQTEIETTHAEHQQLTERLAVVEADLAAPEAPPELAIEHVTLAARLKALGARLLDLAARKEAAENAALLADYKRKVEAMMAAGAECRATDAEIDAALAVVAALRAKRSAQEVERTTAMGRAQNAQNALRERGLQQDAKDIYTAVDKANRR